MFNTRSVLALVVSLSLIGGTPAVLADPGNGKGNPHGNQMDGGKADKGNKGNQGGPGN
ncbi:anti-virulence regulator CigR family protein, partial [Pseudomonas aeruginosa]